MKMKNRLAIRHVVCPVDLTGQFGSSLGYAMSIARVRDAELRAAYVEPGEDAARSSGLGSHERQTLMQRLREALAHADAAYDLVGAAIREGDPGTQILQFARSVRADLIVMGAPRADGPERSVGPVGSVVIARSDCPVLTVPAHPGIAANHTGLFRRIVCGIDPTPSSVSVIRQAMSLAWETGGRLTFVCAISEHSTTTISRTRDALMAALPSEARGWCDLDVVVTTGTPGRELVRLAAEQHADLVVIGPPRRWSSAAHDVLGQCASPILVTHGVRPLPWPAANPGLTGSVTRDVHMPSTSEQAVGLSGGDRVGVLALRQSG